MARNVFFVSARLIQDVGDLFHKQFAELVSFFVMSDCIFIEFAVHSIQYITKQIGKQARQSSATCFCLILSTNLRRRFGMSNRVNSRGERPCARNEMTKAACNPQSSLQDII